MAKLSANHVQQLIHKGDVDIEGLLYKVRLMLGNEAKLDSSRLQVSSSKEKENVKPETPALSEAEVPNLKPET